MSRLARALDREAAVRQLQFVAAMATRNDHMAVSYTHLDVYKRQDLLRRQVNFTFGLLGFHFLGRAGGLIAAAGEDKHQRERQRRPIFRYRRHWTCLLDTSRCV